MLNRSISAVKGIGEARLKYFHRMGIFTLSDMIYHFPREHEDRGNMKKIINLMDGEEAALEGIVFSKVEERRPRKGLSIYKLIFRDETGAIEATWFNQPFIKNVFKVGERYALYGKVSKKYGKIEIQSPIYEKIDEAEMKHTCRIVPIYPSTGGLSQKVIRSVIYECLQMLGNQLIEHIPAALRSKYKLCEINYAVQNIHFPGSGDAFDAARRRLVFDELLLLQLGLLNLKKTMENQQKGILYKPVDGMEDFIKGLPFSLTMAQRKVFREIEEDMKSEKVMNRLVQGDVGSGKTIVAVLAFYLAVKSGYQGAMMVPTEILAEQHYRSLISLLEQHGIRVGLLTGSLSKKQKEEALFNIKNGLLDIVIGTHALLEEDVEFYKLGLVVTDEQHRFGVRQRTVLSKKGLRPDILVMTATPIPRTLALILYGDLDVSIIDELPPGRKKVETYAVDENKRERINRFIEKQVQEGRQVYIVCPLVEESEQVEARSAKEYASKLAKEVFPHLQVGLVHGKMKPSEKEQVMKRFAAGEVQILVSTTVIEVGVNVPNATVMIVENAERFGLAQLHQLRGRVGRGAHQSYCVLFHDSRSKISRERMKVMQETNDGFVISEKDLELRGPGEFFGTRQHGLPELKIANLYKDIEILKLAQNAAFEIVKEDRFLEKEENRLLRDKVGERLFQKSEELNLN